MEMKAQIVADVIPILTLNMLHHNNVGIIYARASNLKMEPLKYVPLYFEKMH
jgi:hypothetical protein